MNQRPNPYQSSGELPNRPQPKRKSPLRFIPAVIIGLFGMAAFAMGVLAILISYRFVFVDRDTTHWQELLASCLLYPSLGICWLLSAALIWRGEYRPGTVAALIGLAVAAVIFGVVGY